MAATAPSTPLRPDPFDLADPAAYADWRARKLAQRPAAAADLVVPVADPYALSEAERSALLDRCRRANMAIYAGPVLDRGQAKRAVRALGAQLGLERLDHNLCADPDGIAALEVAEQGRPQDYIPYSNRPINWHTDGYYNEPGAQVRAFILHCVSPAASGGANTLLDPELLYIALRDQDPALVRALMHPSAMAIPANTEGTQTLREHQSGPVYSVRPEDGSLHLRYTARTRSIEWRDDATTRAAVAAIAAFLQRPDAPAYRHRLAAGEGVLCNNVLHTRDGFTDDPAGGQRRLYLRARYFDRIAGTGPGSGP